MLTRKDFIAIADDLARRKAPAHEIERQINMCAMSNPRFDEQKFRTFIANRKKLFARRQ